MASHWPPSVVFLDRDGVLIENVPSYVRTWEQVEIFPRAVEAVALLAREGVPMVVVTNQSSVGRGILSLDHVAGLNRRILEEIERLAGAKFLAAYLCPHAPDEGCECRKPKPGMLLKAAAEHGLDLSRAVLVGDGLTDIHAAASAGVCGVLVRTGRGLKEEQKMHASRLNRPVFADLLAAVQSRFEGKFSD
jgi:D-glycero-D-manno-heptose 1,7-bisphosphate phosphatase